MRCIRKSLILALGLNSIFFSFSSAENNYSKYTLKRETLQHAGLVRLYDIFALIDEWDNYSVEGYTWQGISNSFDIYQQQNWIILVDGHRLDLKVFDITNINLLPISPNQIDSIEVYISPQQVDDNFSEKGLLHIHTCQIKAGLTMQGQFSAGNETGDPGPYRYTKFWSENVDRVAADESYWFSYRGTSGYLGAGYYAQVYYPTDPLIVDRNRDIYPYANPVIKTYAYSFRAGLSNLYSRPRLDAYYSLLDDFYFFKPLGREIPVKNHFLSIGIGGKLEMNEKLCLDYKLRYSRNGFRKRENSYNIDLNWENERLYANLNSEYKQSMATFKLGVATEWIKSNTDYMLTQNIIQDGILYSSAKFDQESGSQFNIDSEFRFNNHETAFKLSVANLWKLAKNQGLFTTFNYSKTMTYIENSLWFWSEKGYNIVKDYGGDYYIDGELIPARQWLLDFSWHREEDILPSIKAGILYRNYVKKNWEEQMFQYDTESKTVLGQVTINSSQQGQMGCIYIKLKSGQSKTFEHNLFYRYAVTLGNSDLFHRIRKEIPRNLFIYRIVFKPVQNFSVWAMCKYTSSTFWHDFINIEQQSNGLYSADLDDAILIDIAINKWVWKRQIKVDLILRNLLNNKMISYPIGASPDLRFYVNAELYFNFW